jgi:hypothetical protein
MTAIPSPASDPAEWLPVSVTPPAGEDLELCVMDYDEIVVPLSYPCHRSGVDFVDASNKKRIDIQPTHWRKWTALRSAVSTQASTPDQSGAHFYSNWAKERIDEMDAILASFEAKAKQAKEKSGVQADQLLLDLKKRRQEFGTSLKARAEAGEAAWARAKADLERQWSEFETQVRNYFGSVGKQLEQQHTTFNVIVAVQAKAWRDAADRLQDAAAKVVDARRADVDAAVRQMKSDAAEAGTRLQKLKQAGTESWSALSAALAESRKAFDEANHTAWKALKGTAPPKA